MSWSPGACAAKNRARPSTPCAWAAKRCSFPRPRPSANWGGASFPWTPRCVEQPPGFERKVMPEIAIIAALEREIDPLLKSWRNTDQEYSGKRLRFYSGENCVAVCGGIGPVAGRRAAEAAVALYRPNMLVSVGFAGALESNLRVGEVLELRWVIDASDGSRSDTGFG